MILRSVISRREVSRWQQKFPTCAIYLLFLKFNCWAEASLTGWSMWWLSALSASLESAEKKEVLTEDGEGSLAILEPTVISVCDASKRMYLNQGVLFLCADGLTKLQKIGILMFKSSCKSCQFFFVLHWLELKEKFKFLQFLLAFCCSHHFISLSPQIRWSLKLLRRLKPPKRMVGKDRSLDNEQIHRFHK